MAKTRKGINLHLKIDDTLVNLINDYHEHSATEIIAFFHDKMKQMIQLEGNVANKNKQSVRTRGNNFTPRKFQSWRTVKTDEHPFNEPYDAYAYRGFYPDTKIPFKMSGVKHGTETGYACFVVKIGDKDKQVKFTNNRLEHIEQAVADSILLDTKIEDGLKQPVEIKPFRTMTPKGMERLEKGNKDGETRS